MAGLRPDRQHRRHFFEVGRRYADVPPLKGVFSGGGSTGCEVVVERTRLA
ncbi:hypothetical protein [Nocardia sp. R7R-8]